LANAEWCKKYLRRERYTIRTTASHENSESLVGVSPQSAILVVLGRFPHKIGQNDVEKVAKIDFLEYRQNSNNLVSPK
jgi:hypothetical protein